MSSLDDELRKGWTSRVLVASGALVMIYGVVDMLRNADLTTPVVTLGRLGVAPVINDLLLVPLLLGIGALTTRLPVRLRPPIRAALILSGVVLAFALWGSVGQSREVQPGNTHILPTITWSQCFSSWVPSGPP